MLGAAPCLAQPASDVERARALFAEGVSHTQAERWSEAVEAFQAALALRDAPPIRYNLAAALTELGRYREAADHVQAVLASEETAANIRSLAAALDDRIGREAGLLAIDAADADAEVLVDGEPVPSRWRARPLPVSPGTHRVALARGGSTLAETEATVEAGETARVRLEVTTTPTASVPLEEDWRFWLGVGAGAALLVTIIAIVAATSGGEGPIVPGNFTPGVLTW